MLHGGSLCAGNPAVQRQMLEVLAEVRGTASADPTVSAEAGADQGVAGSEKASR